jgi:murein DD-endopeptidase MepM/ murein hydrolase activator NlpD
MAKRRWTIMLVPHGSEPSRIVEVTSSWLKLGVLAVLTVVSVALLTGYGVAYLRGRTGAMTRAAAEREALAAELGRLNSRLGTLTDTVNAISQTDAKIRVLANLDPLDPAVHAAGIGGPAPARLRSDDPLVQHAEQVSVDVSALIRRAELLARSFGQAAESLASHNERLAATPSIMPTRGWLTSAFTSMRAHPILHYARPHEGIDVSAPMGTPIEAPAAGRVAQAGWQAGYGNVVRIDHGFGLQTKYAHASRLLVKTGDRVQRGQRVALVGSTGLSTGPHLHYEVHVEGRPVDPLRYVLSGSAIVD